MSLESMTGYAFITHVYEGIIVRTELKSLNGRFSEFQIKIPKNLYFLEPIVREKLEKHIARGNAACSLNIELPPELSSKMRLSPEWLAAFQSSVSELPPELASKVTLDLSALLGQGDFCVIDTPLGQKEKVTEAVQQALLCACEELNRFRKDEGARLSVSLEASLKMIEESTYWIKSQLPERRQKQEARLKENLLKVLDASGVELQNDRFWNECGLLAERLDVSEEIERLFSHLELFNSTIQSNQSSGKKLGFILQEMLREVNTLATKSAYAPISHRCIELKEELEKMREQVQNIV